MSIAHKKEKNNSGRFKKGHITWCKGKHVFVGKDNPFYGKHHTEETLEKLKARVVSVETRRKISKANKGKPSAFKGRHHSEDAKQKLREKQKAWQSTHIFRHTDETKKRISEAHKGKVFSVEHKRNIGKSKQGKPSWSKGKKLGQLPLVVRQKMSEVRKGEKNPAWRGGISSKHTLLRESIEGRLWKEAVFKRDAWTCQKCKDKKGGNLNAHHIRPFSKFPELRFVVDNGITLCKKCHKKEHNGQNKTSLSNKESG